MMRTLTLLLTGGTMLASVPAVARDGVPSNWRNVTSDADRDRLRNARQTWVDALAKARVSNARAIAAQGVLFDPDVALDNGKLVAGNYRCRIFKLGAKAASNFGFVSYPAAHCRVAPEGDRLRLTKLDGTQRPTGLLYDDGRYRQVFLGTLVLGDEVRVLPYGRDATRNMAGTVERVGPRRWRLALPAPAFESLLDVIELVPER